MNMTMATDHPAWWPALSNDPVAIAGEAPFIRLMRSGAGVWLATWQAEGVELHCLEGSDAHRPVVIRTTTADLPARTPAGLRAPLSDLGSVHRLANPWLWDAITTAVLRQVVRAAQARALYVRWCAAHGPGTATSHGNLSVVPDPQRVLGLADAAFTAAGTAFHRTTLQAAAEAYLIDGPGWERLSAQDLVTALCAIPRIGPWTARAAAADFTGDFQVYPHGDLAVRTWAAQAAGHIAWPAVAATFERTWTALADTGHQLHTLTALTLAWGSHARSPERPGRRTAVGAPAP